MHVTEPEPQGIADQVGEKENQNVHVIQPKPQGLADEGGADTWNSGSFRE